MNNRRLKNPGQNGNEKRRFGLHNRAARRLAIVREENQLRAGLKKIKQRHISTRALRNAYIELLKDNPDWKKVKSIEQRLQIEIGDLEAKIERIRKITRLEIGLNGLDGIVEAAPIQINIDELYGAIEADKLILNELSQKRLEWQQEHRDFRR